MLIFLRRWATIHLLWWTRVKWCATSAWSSRSRGTLPWDLLRTWVAALWKDPCLTFGFPQIPMNLFIMYMSGNSISIFPIMMVGMMLIRPIKAIFTTQVTSKMAEGAQGTGQRIVYFLGNLANVALALYKCHSMGLLPTHASDWLAFVQPQTRLEYYGGGISFV